MNESIRNGLKYSTEIITGLAILPAIAIGVAGNVIERHCDFKIFRGFGFLVGRTCTILIAVSSIPLIIVGIAKATFFSMFHQSTPCSLKTKEWAEITYSQLQQSSTFVFSLIAILINFDVVNLLFHTREYLREDNDHSFYAIQHAFEMSMDDLNFDDDFKKSFLERLETACIKFDEKREVITPVEEKEEDNNIPPPVDSPKQKPGVIEKPKTPSPKNRPPSPPGVIANPLELHISQDPSPPPIAEPEKNIAEQIKPIEKSPLPTPKNSDKTPSPDKSDEGYIMLPTFVKNLFTTTKKA